VKNKNVVCGKLQE